MDFLVWVGKTRNTLWRVFAAAHSGVAAACSPHAFSFAHVSTCTIIYTKVGNRARVLIFGSFLNIFMQDAPFLLLKGHFCLVFMRTRYAY